MQRNGFIARIGLLALAVTVTVTGLNVRGAYAQAAKTIPDVVAKVNGISITRAQLERACLDFHGVYRMEDLIAATLIEEEAKKQAITVTPKEIEDKVAELKKNSGTFSTESFRSWLLQNEWTEARYKDKARLMLLIGKVFEKQANITDAKAQKYYDENKSKFTVQASCMMWALSAMKKEAIDKATGMAKAGQKFPDIATALGESVRVSTAGGSPSPLVFTLNNDPRLPAELKAQIATAKPGQILGPIAQPLSALEPDGPKIHYIFLVESKQDQRLRTFDEVKQDIKSALFDEAVFGPLGYWNRWLEDARKKATVERFLTFTGEPAVDAAGTK